MNKYTARLLLIGIPLSLLSGSYSALGASYLPQPDYYLSVQRPASGTGIPHVDNDSANISRRHVDATIYFRIGQSRLDPDFEGNRQRLDSFISSLQRVQADPDYVVNHIVVTGTASPDGTQARNLKLAGMRAQTLANYILTRTSFAPDKVRVVNGGENWTALRTMIESSEMPGKESVIQLMDRYPDDTETLKRQMQYFADGKPWRYMYQHFFPALRLGAGGTQGIVQLSTLSRENWELTRNIVLRSNIDASQKRALFDIMDSTTSPREKERLLLTLCSGNNARELQKALTDGLLNAPNALSESNWTVLYNQIAASELPQKAEVLRIINEYPSITERESRLRAIDGGKSYQYIMEQLVPTLLSNGTVASQQVSPAPNTTQTLSDANWKHLRALIAVSEMPGRQQVLELIDRTPTPVERERLLRELNGGESYTYLNEVLVPELLYGLSETSQENWRLLRESVETSELPHKEEILNIIATTAPGAEREKAIYALDGGESWQRISERMLPRLLLSTEDVTMTGSGMSFFYQLSPSAQARAMALNERQSEAGRLANTAATPPQAKPVAHAPVQQLLPWRPCLAIKTDLMLWATLMPGFEAGTYTPNLAAEVYFSRRWSAQIGGSYSNWNALSGEKGLFACTAAELEVRHWFGTPTAFKGFYLGVYGRYGEYDVQQGVEGQTGSFVDGGAAVGWAQPLSKHWLLEAEIRGGYRSADNSYYDIEESHYYFNRSQKEGTFVPQLQLNIMYRFGKSGK